MKKYSKRSTAALLCLALLMGLFAGVPGALITNANAEETTGTATTPSAVFNIDKDGMDWTALQSQGWTVSNDEVGAPEVVEKDGNKVLTVKNTNLTTVRYIYSPYIELGDATTLYFAMEAMKTAGRPYAYVRFFDANKQRIGYTDADGKAQNHLQFASHKASDGKWVTLSTVCNFAELVKTCSIEKTPAYCQIMLQMEKPGDDGTIIEYCWDNLSLTTDHTAHAFTEASDLVQTAGNCETPAVYWGKCACGAVSHVETVAATTTAEHTYDNDADTDCNVCGETRVVEPEVTGIAAIIRGDVTTGYATIAEALAAVQEGDTLKLLADVSEAITLTNLKNVVIDGNGKTITTQVKITTGIQGLTIKNVTFDAKGVYFYKSVTENATISNCTFKSNATITSTSSGNQHKDLTISGCTFESYSSDVPTATAIRLRTVTNLTITGNTFKGVQWNGMQVFTSTGNIAITDNVINWIATRTDADGIFNLVGLTDAKVTLKGNTVTTTNSASTFPIVYAQYGATNTALYLYDNLTFGHGTGDALAEFKNTETAADHTIYCTGHTYDNDADTTCNVCGAERKVEPEVTGVAAIIRGDVTTGYATITEALNALQAGDTLKLLADIDAAFTMAKNVANVTFDGNGHTLKGVIKVENGGYELIGWTIQNVIFDGTADGYLVFRAGTKDGLTVKNCTFQNGAYISSYGVTKNKNLTISGCTFVDVNKKATSTAALLSKVENVTFTNNTINGVTWNAVQVSGSGKFDISNNTINWTPTRNDADGVFNLNNLSNAQITLKGNTVTSNGVSPITPIYVQYGAENVVVYLYDNQSSFSYKTDDPGAVKFEAPVKAADHTVYCTGHTYDNDADTTCNACGAERTVTPPAPAVTEGTIAQALAGELKSLWKVTGVITLIEGKNLYIQDETGAICARLSADPTDLAVGDNVTIEGARADYKKLPQLNVSSCTKVSKTITITPKDVTLPLTVADLCKAVKLSGVTITEIKENNAKGFFDITVSDGTNTIQIYKAVAPEGLAVGDKVDVVAVLSCYNDTLQLRNDEAADIVKVSAGDDDNTGDDNTGDDNTGDDNTDNTPDATGDNTAIVAMISVMAIAVAVLAVLVVGKKRMF